jgi:hypothetical protein
MSNLVEPYIVTVDRLRNSPSRDSKPDQTITIAQDRVLVASYLIGVQYTSMVAIWVEKEVSENDKMLFIGNYISHVGGFLEVVVENLDSQCSDSVRLAYSLIQRHQGVISVQKEPRLGKSLCVGVMLSIFLVEFWKRSVHEKPDVLPFPTNPGFIQRRFLDRAIESRPDIKEWIEDRKYLSTLPLSSILDDFSSLLKNPTSP